MARTLDYASPESQYRLFHAWLLPLLWVACVGGLWMLTFGRGEETMAPIFGGIVGGWPFLVMHTSRLGWDSVVAHCVFGGGIMALLGWSQDRLRLGRSWPLVYPALGIAIHVWNSRYVAALLSPTGLLFSMCMGIYLGVALLYVVAAVRRIGARRRSGPDPI